MKKTKKVDVKKVAKEKVMTAVATALKTQGFEIVDGEAFGFTSGTLVVKLEGCDVQLKPITPKAGVEHYEVLPVEEEVVEEAADETPAEDAKEV